jgi:hypothetical protein
VPSRKRKRIDIILDHLEPYRFRTLTAAAERYQLAQQIEHELTVEEKENQAKCPKPRKSS